ncbi:hypothetical protein LJR225_002214 [Phenylobacterium sp. LjRoot225]|uniref:hypothetical protein n=1 Tax=Phenylobacterium sp. LjRoot225 TaxID=3342285 RepID=UPI003ECD7DB2
MSIISHASSKSFAPTAATLLVIAGAPALAADTTITIASGQAADVYRGSLTATATDN